MICSSPGCDSEGVNICVACSEFGCEPCYREDCFHDKDCKEMSAMGFRNRALKHLAKARMHLARMNLNSLQETLQKYK